MFLIEIDTFCHSDFYKGVQKTLQKTLYIDGIGSPN